MADLGASDNSRRAHQGVLLTEQGHLQKLVVLSEQVAERGVGGGIDETAGPGVDAVELRVGEVIDGLAVA
ncbi:hypothetical protein ABTZ03_36095 [Kitasatospora sp. NPDC096077]|uniref:hypothetical protein n=1 Tax=Kitasatospora sp. NPDC096077 TaxID=3155544 RepID=UPI00331BDBD8